MAKTLIKTPFPSTAEVAKKLGVSRERVQEVERIVSSQKADLKADKKVPTETEPASRDRR